MKIDQLSNKLPRELSQKVPFGVRTFFIGESDMGVRTKAVILLGFSRPPDPHIFCLPPASLLIGYPVALTMKSSLYDRPRDHPLRLRDHAWCRVGSRNVDRCWGWYQKGAPWVLLTLPGALLTLPGPCVRYWHSQGSPMWFIAIPGGPLCALLTFPGGPMCFIDTPSGPYVLYWHSQGALCWGVLGFPLLEDTKVTKCPLHVFW